MKGDKKHPRQDAIPSYLPRITSSLASSSSRIEHSFAYHSQRLSQQHERATEVGEGATIADRYCLEKRLGNGVTGQIFRALDLQTQVHVALKIFHPYLANQNTFLELFTYDFLRTKQMNHPNIVQVYELERDSIHKIWYLAMEYVPGMSVQQMLDARTQNDTTQPFPLDQVRLFVDSLFPAVEYLHTQHIIHRDLKPSHLLWTSTQQQRSFKIIGFGRSASVSDVCHSSSHLGQVASSFYTAPEQMVHGQKAVPATDVFSLGVMLYQTLTGRLPVGIAERPSEQLDYIPKDVDDVLSKALHPRWQDRYNSVAIFHRAFQEALDGPVVVWDTQSASTHEMAKQWPREESQVSGQPFSMQLSSQHASPHIHFEEHSYGPSAGQSSKRSSLDRTQSLKKTPRFSNPYIESIEPSPSIQPESTLPGAHRITRPKRDVHSVGSTRIVPRVGEGYIEPASSVVSNSDRLNRLRKVRHKEREAAAHAGPVSVAKPSRSLSFHTEQKEITTLAFSPDGCFLASAAFDGTIKLWEVPSWYLLHTIDLGTAAVRNIAWAPNGHWLAMSDDEGTIHVRNVMDPSKKHSFPIHTACLALTWSQDGRTLWAGGADGIARIWEFGSILQPKELLLHRGEICALATLSNPKTFQIGMMPNPFLLSGGTDGCVSLWDIHIRQPIYRFNEPGTSICSVASHPNEPLFISGNDRGELQYWEPRFSGQTRSWQAHFGAICHLQVAHHGEWFISGDAGNTVKMWRTTDGELIASFSTQQIPLQGIALSPDSHWLAMIDEGNAVKLWDIST